MVPFTSQGVLQMTFLDTRFRFARPLSRKELESLSHLSTVYGIRTLHIENQDLIVEYDASRIYEAEVLSAIRQAGVSVVPEKPIPPGGFDYTGEFKDFAWPTQGLSPANRKLK